MLIYYNGETTSLHTRFDEFPVIIPKRISLSKEAVLSASSTSMMTTTGSDENDLIREAYKMPSRNSFFYHKRLVRLLAQISSKRKLQ